MTAATHDTIYYRYEVRDGLTCDLIASVTRIEAARRAAAEYGRTAVITRVEA